MARRSATSASQVTSPKTGRSRRSCPASATSTSATNRPSTTGSATATRRAAPARRPRSAATASSAARSRSTSPAVSPRSMRTAPLANSGPLRRGPARYRSARRRRSNAKSKPRARGTKRSSNLCRRLAGWRAARSVSTRTSFSFERGGAPPLVVDFTATYSRRLDGMFFTAERECRSGQRRRPRSVPLDRDPERSDGRTAGAVPRQRQLHTRIADRRQLDGRPACPDPDPRHRRADRAEIQTDALRQRRLHRHGTRHTHRRRGGSPATSSANKARERSTRLKFPHPSADLGLKRTHDGSPYGGPVAGAGRPRRRPAPRFPRGSGDAGRLG